MSDLLKQAIADAKAVRATALSNAKAALEEHFAPKLQMMLSEKLKAEVAAEEEGAEEALPVADFGGEEHADAGADAAAFAPDAGVDAAPAEEIPMDAPVDAGLDAGLDGAPVGSENPEAPIDGAAPVEDPSVAPVDGEEELDLESRGTEQSGNYDVTQHGISAIAEGDKASSDYKKTTSGHKTEDPLGKTKVVASSKKTGADTAGAGLNKSSTTSGKASSNFKTMPKGNQVKNINASGTEDPQGASSEVSDGSKKTDTNVTAALKENDEVDEASLDEILKELEMSVQENGVEDVTAPVAPADDEELDLNELLSEDDDKDDDDKKKKSEKKDDDDRGNKLPWMTENISLKKELQEYRSAVVYLRDRINEVNLLNAKLLYTNRLFKQASLTTEQKLKVIESFDLTKSVREAKLVYATLAESFNFGGKKVVAPAKKPVTTNIKSITEGLASKQVASTKPTKTAVLTEGAIMANRFQKLAGIRK